MNRTLATWFSVLLLVAAHDVSAQDSAPQPARIEVTIIPSGATYFTKASDTGEPSFTNYDAGVAFAVNLNRIVAVEGEVVGSLGISQSLAFATFTQDDVTSPNLLQYAGNLVVSAPTSGSVVPFITAGAGGMTVFDRAELIQRANTFFAGNVGGGVKWRAGRWGLRAEYRFLAVRHRDTEFAPNERPRPDFFGKETRFGHRVFGGIILHIG